MMKSNLITFLKSPWLIEFKSHNSFFVFINRLDEQIYFPNFFFFVKMPYARQKLTKEVLFQMHFSKARWPPITKYKIETGLKISKYTIKILGTLKIPNFTKFGLAMTNPTVQYSGSLTLYNHFIIKLGARPRGTTRICQNGISAFFV